MMHRAINSLGVGCVEDKQAFGNFCESHVLIADRVVSRLRAGQAPQRIDAGTCVASDGAGVGSVDRSHGG